MAINWQEVITSLGGNAVLLAAIAWLIKLLVSNRFAREAEQFKAELKSNTDAEIERLRAFLTRASRVHEQQVETLKTLYGQLRDAQDYLQAMTRGSRLEGERSDEEYYRAWSDAIRSAFKTLSSSRLLIPPDLVQDCDRFFDTVFQGWRDFGIARNPMVVHVDQRAEFWRKAQETAGKEVPNILHQIEVTARSIIHGDPAAR